jgi:hypothetical protein
MEIVGLDDRNMPVLLRPSGHDVDGIVYEVSSDPKKDRQGRITEEPRRPVLVRPSTTGYHADPTNESIKAAKLMGIAEGHRDHHFSEVRLNGLVVYSYTTPEALGIEDENLPQFNGAGDRVNPDPTNLELRSLAQLNLQEGLRLFLRTEPDSFNEKIARKALKLIAKEMKHGEHQHHIVLNHGKHKTWYKPWTYKHGHGGHHDHYDDHAYDQPGGHDANGRYIPTLEEATEAAEIVGSQLSNPGRRIYNHYTERDQTPLQMDEYAAGWEGENQPLKEAIETAAEARRILTYTRDVSGHEAQVQEIIDLFSNNWQHRRHDLLAANPTKRERRVLHELEEAVRKNNLHLIEELRAGRHEFGELKDALSAAEKLVRAHHIAEPRLERARTPVRPRR